MFISFAAVVTSIMNSDIKGIIYAAGICIVMFLGNLLSSTFPYRVPGYQQGTRNRIRGSATFNPACNTFGGTGEGWGTLYSSPEAHALFFGFTLVYMCSGMFFHNNINWLVLIALLLLTILSGFFRTSSSMLCANYVDLFIGLGMGFVFGLIYYIIISSIESSYSPQLDLTYFNSLSNKEKCGLQNKKFVCKKVKKSK